METVRYYERIRLIPRPDRTREDTAPTTAAMSGGSRFLATPASWDCGSRISRLAVAVNQPGIASGGMARTLTSPEVQTKLADLAPS